MATFYYRPYTSEPVQDGDLPPVNAMESVLPEYQYIFVDPNKPKKSFNPAELDRTSMGLLDYQMKELDSYRTAIQKMGQDVLSLRQLVRDKEIENSKLRSDLTQFNDSTKLLMDSQDLDGLTKPQLAARYVGIKKKAVSQTAEIREYKERIHKLQNELIKKNDREREYMKVGQAHISQNELLQKVQDKVQKVQKLEEAIRKQEKVIDNLERLLNKNTPNTSNRDIFINDTNDSLLEENRRLRDQLRSQKEDRRQKPQRDQDDLDTLKMYEKLDRAEARIASLDKQLSDSARQWGKEKADMQIRLTEAEHGLGRSSNLLLHDFASPMLNSNRRMDLTDRSEPRRFSKAQRKGRSPKLEPLRY